MDNASRNGFISLTFVAGFGLGIFLGALLGVLAVLISLPEDETPDVVEIPVFVTGTPPPDGAGPAVVRTRNSLEVRVGPGDSYATLGTIARGDQVNVIGRDFESKWLAIRFPVGSNSRGWIPADSVEGLEESSVTTLAVLLPTPLPFVFNTPSPFFGFGGSDVGGSNGSPARTPTPVPTTSDLEIGGIRVLADGRISVTVTNRGPKSVSGDVLIVLVRDLSGIGERLIYTNPLPSGDSVTLRTETFRLREPGEVQVVVDPSNSLPDPIRGNNLRTFTLVPPPTPEPPPAPTELPPG